VAGIEINLAVVVDRERVVRADDEMGAVQIVYQNLNFYYINYFKRERINMISKGVMEISKGLYRVGCSCGNPNCDLMLIVDKESINVYSELSWSDYTYKENVVLEKIYSVWDRIRTSIRILFTGKFALSSELVIIDNEHAKNIAEILMR